MSERIPYYPVILDGWLVLYSTEGEGLQARWAFTGMEENWLPLLDEMDTRTDRAAQWWHPFHAADFPAEGIQVSVKEVREHLAALHAACAPHLAKKKPLQSQYESLVELCDRTRGRIRIERYVDPYKGAPTIAPGLRFRCEGSGRLKLLRHDFDWPPPMTPEEVRSLSRYWWEMLIATFLSLALPPVVVKHFGPIGGIVAAVAAIVVWFSIYPPSIAGQTHGLLAMAMFLGNAATILVCLLFIVQP